jgi:hypothetical protein
MHLADAWSAFTALTATQHGVATRRQAATLGLDAKRIAARKRDRYLIELVPGVLLVAGTQPTFRQRLMVATLAGNSTVASHRSAALLHGLDGIDAAPVEVTVRRGRFPTIDGVVVHRATPLDHRDVTVVDGIRATSVARTLCDLGAVVAQDDVERCLDGALRRGVSEDGIRETLRRVRRPGPSGTQTLDRILSDPRRTGGVPANWFERLLRRAVDAPDLPPIVLQYEVRVGGRVVARFDAAIPEWRIGLEAHSAHWHNRPGRVWRDLERDNKVKALGWNVVYVTWALAHRPEQVLDLVRRTHASRAAS